MRRFASLGLGCAAVIALAGVALAQNTPTPTPTGVDNTSSSAAPGASSGAATTHNLTGYGYGGGTNAPVSQQHPQPQHGKAAVKHTVPAAAGPIATLPGFEMQADGSSRCFVQLTAAVPIEEKKAAGTVTYLLKGAHVTLRNNENALVTVHFNTPVTRARLTPAPQGLAFIIDLRANVAPTYKVVAGKEGSSILEVDFPKGNYVTAADGRQDP